MTGAVHCAATYYLPRSQGGDVQRPLCHAKRPGHGTGHKISPVQGEVSCRHCKAMLTTGAAAPAFPYVNANYRPRRSQAKPVAIETPPEPRPPVPLVLPEPADRGPSLSEIALLVAAARGTDLATLKGAGRSRAIAHARQEAMWLARQQRKGNGEQRFSSTTVGRFFGGRDHTTVLHAERVVKARMAEAAE